MQIVSLILGTYIATYSTYMHYMLYGTNRAGTQYLPNT